MDDQQFEIESEFADTIQPEIRKTTTKVSSKVNQASKALIINDSPLFDIITKLFQKKTDSEEVKDIQSYINQNLSSNLIQDKSDSSTTFIQLLKTFEPLFTKDPYVIDTNEYPESFDIIKKQITTIYPKRNKLYKEIAAFIFNIYLLLQSGDTGKDPEIVKEIKKIKL